MREIDTKENIPIAIIFADVNGLKLTNDIFGHGSGDALIKTAANVLKKACREKDAVARMGGDEFIILLPNTERSEVEKIMDRVRFEISMERIAAINCSISLGCDIKTNASQDIEQIIANAENNMYQDKTMNRQTVNSDLINTMISTLYFKSPREGQHSINVTELSLLIGEEIGLPETELKKLKQAGFLHDIGKIALNEKLVNKEELLTPEEKKELKQHAVVGFRLLNLFDNTLDLAEVVYSHHERWDGSGYPKRLKGEEIPILARIIAVAEHYDSRTSKFARNMISSEAALAEIKQQAGRKFDTEIVDAFIRVMTSAE